MASEIIPSSELKQATAELWRDRIDAGGAAGSVEIQSASGTVLATLALPYPCGAHSLGKLVFGAIANVFATATGLAAKALFKTSAGATVLTTNVSSSSGTAFCRLNNTSITSGSAVSVSSCEISF